MVWAMLRLPTAETVPKCPKKCRYLSSRRDPQSLSVSQYHLKHDFMNIRQNLAAFIYVCISRH